MLTAWTPAAVCFVLIVATLCAVVVILVARGRYDLAEKIAEALIRFAAKKPPAPQPPNVSPEQIKTALHELGLSRKTNDPTQST